MQRDITDVYLQTLAPPTNGRLEIQDTRVNGLTLRVTPAGVCTWTVRARLADGKRVRPSLGHWPAVSIREARKQARVALGEITTGKDPAAEKRAARAARAAYAARPTVATRLNAWRALKLADWSERYAREVERLCTKIIIPRLGDREFSGTSRGDWIDMIAVERQRRPGTATWLFSITSAFSNYAEVAGWIDRPLLPRKGLGVIAPHADPRDRVLTDDELAAVWRASSTRSPKTRAFVRLLILTGCRVSEAAGLALDELDPTHGQWTIPATRSKNNRALTVPLPATLMGEILALAPASGPANCRLLGLHHNSPLQGISRVKTALDQESRVTGWRLHDVRRTVRTGLARLGVTDEIAERVLNHATGGLLKVYNHYRYVAEIRSALVKWQEHVASLAVPKLVAAPAA
jgi:integrase